MHIAPTAQRDFFRYNTANTSIYFRIFDNCKMEAANFSENSVASYKTQHLRISADTISKSRTYLKLQITHINRFVFLNYVTMCQFGDNEPLQMQHRISLLNCKQMYPLLTEWLPTFHTCHSQ